MAIEFPSGMAHMPFIADEPDMTVPACCIKESGVWKAVYLKDGKWTRLVSGLPDSYTECSPFLYEDIVTGRLRGSVIAGNLELGEEHDFALFSTDDVSSGTWKREGTARAGLVFKGTTIYSGYGNPIVFVRENTRFRVTLIPALYIYRITLDSRNPYHAIVTFQSDADDSMHTWIVGAEDRTVRELVLTDGTCAYKPCFLGDELYYAERTDGFEDREIRHTDSYRTISMDFDSCIQVEKSSIRQIDEEFE